MSKMISSHESVENAVSQNCERRSILCGMRNGRSVAAALGVLLACCVCHAGDAGNSLGPAALVCKASECATQTEMFAAEELRHWLGMISETPVAETFKVGTKYLELFPDDKVALTGTDGFAVRRKGGAIYIAALFFFFYRKGRDVGNGQKQCLGLRRIHR